MKNDAHSISFCSIRSEQIRDMFDRISPGYDRLNTLMSFGIFNLWHARLLRESGCPQQGTIADFCTGTGEVLLRFCRRFDISRGVGIDISEKMLEIARRKAKQAGVDNRLEFFNRPAESSRLAGGFDCATMTFALRNVSDIEVVFREMLRAVKPGGTVLALELTRPVNSILRVMHWVYLKCCLPVIGALFAGDREAYTYLASSILRLPPAERILAIMKSAGIKDPTAISLSGGIATLFKGTRSTNDPRPFE